MVPKNFDKILIDRLSTCYFNRENTNVIIYGATGTGKTFLTKALGVQACNEALKQEIYI